MQQTIASSPWRAIFFLITLASMVVAGPTDRTITASSREMRDVGLIVGNLNFNPTDGILRYDGTGAFVDVLVPQGRSGLTATCCIAFGPDDNLYVSDVFASRVLRFNGLTGEFIDEFVAAGSGGLGMPLILVFRDDMLYVGDLADHSIKRYDAGTGAFVDVFVQDNPAVPMGLYDPQHFAFGPDGNLYVASEFANRVLRYDGVTGAFIDEFLPAEYGFTRPSGLTFGPDGLLYVGSVDMNEVRRFDVRTGAAEVFVSAGAGGLALPVGIAFGPDGNLYVTSVNTAEILRYDGRSGAFMGPFVRSGLGGLSGPRTLAFKSKVTVCHRSAAGGAKRHAITIGYLSGLEHIAHGDTIGVCP